MTTILLYGTNSAIIIICFGLIIGDDDDDWIFQFQLEDSVVILVVDIITI